jgi:type II secretory pathway component PulK
MKSERGFATLIVLTLLLMITAVVIANGLVLHHLRSEIQLIERRQQERFNAGKK